MGNRTNLKKSLASSVFFVATIIVLLLGENTAKAIVTGEGTFVIARLNNGEPILTEAMFDALGATNYDIRMSWAEDIEGPWHLYQTGSGVSAGDRGVLDLGSDDKIDLDNGVTISNHVASPDVFVDDENQRIVMYFHAGSVRVDGTGLGQKSMVATSDYGLEFESGIEPVILGWFYFRVFEYKGNLYATSNRGKLFKARDPNHPWTPPPGFDFKDDLWIERPTPNPFFEDLYSFDFSGVPDTPERCRHFTVRRVGDTVQMLYTRIGDCPERIKMSTIDMSVGDYDVWDPTFPPEEILYAELDWEGGDIVPTNSQGSTAPENVNQLRDPYLFEDSDGQWYLFYCARGEDAIGVAHIRDIPRGDFDQDGYTEIRDLEVLAAEWLEEAGDLRADLDGDDKVNFTDFAIWSEGWTGPDMTCPTPEPMTWASVPVALDSNSIEMTAGFATDFNGAGVEYYFNNVTDPNHDSGWLSSPVHDPCHLNGWQTGPVQKYFYYLDTGLDPNTTYTYQVKVRDKSANHNETGWSSSQSATTEPMEPVTIVLVGPGASADYYVPPDANWETTWMQTDFNELAGWDTGTTGLGFGFGGEPRVAYNDCYREGGDETAANVTDWTIHDEDISRTTGKLKDFATGSDAGMPTVTFTMGEAGLDVGQPTSGGNPDPGTDAYDIFGNIVDFSGRLVTKGDPGWWVEIEFTGLAPTTTYTFIGTAIRAGVYPDRITLCTIIGANSFIWNSSNPGVGGSEDTAELQAGDNRSTGYVVRWDDIVSGLDGSFKVRVEATEDSEDGKAYALGGFMLQGGLSGVSSDLQDDMLGFNASLWSRIEFDVVEDTSLFSTLKLRMKYDDGFVAYLNGVEVTRDNFTGTPSWNSVADSDRQNDLALQFVDFDISDHISDLRQGLNVLAIHGLNDNVDDPNFLLLPELVTVSYPGSNGYTNAMVPVKNTRFTEILYHPAALNLPSRPKHRPLVAWR
ncbi:hypothetical protein ES703_37102 [subsurface metagenome]